MLKIAICDDQQQCLRQADQFIRSYFKNKSIYDYEIDAYDNPLLFLEKIETNGGYDMVLLDICMPGIMGTAVAQEIRDRQDVTEIIFLTTSDEFAVDAFALKATHYLIKPYTKDEFYEAMDRAFAKIMSVELKKLSVKLEGGNICFIDISEIIYIESVSHSQNIYLKNGMCSESRRSLARIFEELEKLSPGQFILPFKGYIVNQKAIATIESKYINLQNEVKIPLARNTFRALSEQYFQYMFGKTGKRNDGNQQ